MLAFYWTDLNGKQHIRKTLIAMFVFVSSCYMVSFLDDTFYSGGNVAVQWSQEEGACSVFYAVTPFYLNYALGQACYLVIYTAPLILYRKGILDRAFALTFATGALPLLAGTIRFICLKVGTGQDNLVCESRTAPHACN